MSRLLLSTAVAGLMLGAVGSALASADQQIALRGDNQTDVSVEQAKPDGQASGQGNDLSNTQSVQKQSPSNQSTSNAGRVIVASDVIGMTIASAEGEDLGKVDGVVYDTSGQYYLVVSRGGFLGLGEEKSYVPMEFVGFSDDALIVTSSADLQPDYDSNGFTPVDPDFEIKTSP